MLTASYSTLDCGVLYYEKGCHQCGKDDERHTCPFNCDHYEIYEDEDDVSHSTQSKNYFCKDCFDKFEECGCGCKTKMCIECADSDRCPHCGAPLCSEYIACQCIKTK